MSSFDPGGRFRFADPHATREYVFGPCQCPGAPHEQDTAEVLLRVSPSAKARIGRAELEGAVRLDPLAAHRQMVLEGVVRWNLLWPDPNGKENGSAKPLAVPINAASVELLEDLVPLAEWIDKLWEGSDPNSAAPSRGLRRGSKRPTPTTIQPHGT